MYSITQQQLFSVNWVILHRKGSRILQQAINGAAWEALYIRHDKTEWRNRTPPKCRRLERQNGYSQNAAFHRLRLVSRHARTGNRIRRTDYHHITDKWYSSNPHADSVYQRSLHSHRIPLSELTSQREIRIYM
jgi:hypothetical protein